MSKAKSPKSDKTQPGHDPEAKTPPSEDLLSMARSLKTFDSSALYQQYRVVVKFRDRVHGPRPGSPELLEKHIIRSTGHQDVVTEELVRQAAEGLPPDPGDIDEVTNSSRSVFARDEHGLYLDSYALKACFRQSGSMLGAWMKLRGSKQIAAEGTEVKGHREHANRIYLMRDLQNPTHVVVPDGVEDSPVHIVTAAGRVNGIKSNEYVDGAHMLFFLWVLRTSPRETRHIGEDLVRAILTFAQNNGVGANRSKGMGKFDVVEFQSI